MLRSMMFVVAGLILCLPLVSADEKKADKTKASSKVTVSSVSVYKKLDDKNFPYYNASSGLGIHVSVPGKHVLSVDAMASKVEKFEDDKKNALNEGFSKPMFSSYASFGKDRSSLITSVYGNKSPGQGSSKIHLKGSLVLVCGKDAKSTKEEEVEVKLNEEKKIGDYTIKFTYVPQAFGASFSVTMAKNNLKDITVTDGDGKEITTTTYGVPYYNFTSKNWTTTYNLGKKADKVKIKVNYFDSTESVTVPVDVSGGLDL